MRDTMNMHGQVRVIGEARDGRIVFDQAYTNRIVQAGRRLVAQLFAGVTGTPPGIVTHMGVGTGGAVPADGDTQLVAERARNPVAAPVYSAIVDTTGVQRIKVTLQTVFDFGEANGTDPLREAAIFTAAAGGTMYNRVVFDAVTKANTFKLTLIWDIVF